MVHEKYEITKLIAKGMFGQIYEGIDLVTSKKVVIKKSNMMKPKYSKNVLEREMEILSILGEYNCFPKLIDHYTFDQNYFLIIEFLDGKTLEDLLCLKGKITVTETIFIIKSVLQALSVMHELEIVHRDVKPSNIFITANGEVKLIDFSISESIKEKRNKIIHDESFELGQTYPLRGTPIYMSPEIQKDCPLRANIDLYSLGVVFYQCITGEAPFRATGYSSLMTEKEGFELDIKGMSRLYKDAYNIINRLIVSDPNLRYQTAKEVLYDIDVFIDKWDIKLDGNRSLLFSSLENVDDLILPNDWLCDDKEPSLRMLFTSIEIIDKKLQEVLEIHKPQPYETPEAYKELKVFVSSTMEELKDERDAVTRAILELGLSVLKAESFGAPGMSSYEVCMKAARECDIFVGIIGLGFGYAPNNETRSVTEMEYDSAKENNPAKLLIYMKEGKVEDSNQIRFRKKISDFNLGYFRPTFTSVDQLYQLVKSDIPTWMINRIKANYK